jgi:hypothetical protein
MVATGGRRWFLLEHQGQRAYRLIPVWWLIGTDEARPQSSGCILALPSIFALAFLPPASNDPGFRSVGIRPAGTRTVEERALVTHGISRVASVEDGGENQAWELPER